MDPKGGQPRRNQEDQEELGLLDRNYSARTLVKALAHKMRRRALGVAPQIEPAYRLGYLVFDRRDLAGGGPEFGQDYVRVLTEIGFKQCDRLFEFCAGPGYIGYSLLSRGFCRTLALADINPLAVEAATRTAGYNGIAQRVSIYVSDGLDDIPDSERWDLVVGNPPHFSNWTGHGKLLHEDPDWQLHRRFYSQVRHYLAPGGKVLLQENSLGSSADTFIPMIQEWGGRHGGTFLGPDIGPGGSMYYILSHWG